MLTCKGNKWEESDVVLITITKEREVPAHVDLVWDVISNTDEQTYWRAIKNIRVLSRKGDTIEREATVSRGPLGDAKSLQTIVLDQKKKSITLNMTKGPMLGTRKITLVHVEKEKTRIEVGWEFEMKGVPSFAEGFVKQNISDVTEEALDRIAQEAIRSATERNDLRIGN